MKENYALFRKRFSEKFLKFNFKGKNCIPFEALIFRSTFVLHIKWVLVEIGRESGYIFAMSSYFEPH
jgi:hypothetical protein